MSEERQRLARRLSGALGRRIDPDEVEPASNGHAWLGDELVPMMRGNVAWYRRSWWRNGVELSEEEADRLLPKS
jgi:hypothetical protein